MIIFMPRNPHLTTRTRIIGPGLIFERLWQQCGIRQVLRELLEDRQFEFSVDAPCSSPSCIG
jgi:hypothetical protein